ncbi:MAG: phage terminase large subunit family protein [Pontibacterium sp.]
MTVVDGSDKRLPFDLSLTPYMREPMDMLASRSHDAVVFIGPARTGKTLSMLEGWLTYTVTANPGDMLIIQISEEKAREFSKKRVDRLFRHSPNLHSRLSQNGFDNNVHDKILKSGMYLGLKWPSINVMSSSDYRSVALTDYDRLPESIGGEGDPFSLAQKRTQTFGSSGMTMIETSPGWDIDAEFKPDPARPHMAPPARGAVSLYNEGTRARWYWQCEESACGGWYQPSFDNFNMDAAAVFCPHCSTLVDPSRKFEINQRGKFIHEHEITGTTPHTRIASYWMEGPAAGFQNWGQLASRYKAAEQIYLTTGSQETLKARINTDWGRSYRYTTEHTKRSAEALQSRSERTGKRVVPEGVRCLVAAVDVQGGRKRRFVCQIEGRGEHGERWIIDRFNIRKSERKDSDGERLPIDPLGYVEDWDALITNVITRKYPLSDGSGREMAVIMTAIDTGGEGRKDGDSKISVTDNAYRFFRKLGRLSKKVLLVKGASTKTTYRIKETWPDNTGRKSRSASSRGDIPLYLLGTNLLKDGISAALERETEGPNFIHFPDWLGEWFYDEITAESRDDATGKWSRPGKQPNEAFDLLCYTEAVCLKIGYDKIQWSHPPQWARLWDNNSEVIQSGDVKPEPVKRTRRRAGRVNR